jgi:hypothetical protein
VKGAAGPVAPKRTPVRAFNIRTLGRGSGAVRMLRCRSPALGLGKAPVPDDVTSCVLHAHGLDRDAVTGCGAVNGRIEDPLAENPGVEPATFGTRLV